MRSRINQECVDAKINKLGNWVQEDIGQGALKIVHRTGLEMVERWMRRWTPVFSYSGIAVPVDFAAPIKSTASCPVARAGRAFIDEPAMDFECSVGQWMASRVS